MQHIEHMYHGTDHLHFLHNAEFPEQTQDYER